jgi:hypothetical protein
VECSELDLCESTFFESNLQLWKIE